MSVPTSTSVCVNIPLYTNDEQLVLMDSNEYSAILIGRISKSEFKERCIELELGYQGLRHEINSYSCVAVAVDRLFLMCGYTPISRKSHDIYEARTRSEIAEEKQRVLLRFIDDMQKKYERSCITIKYRETPEAKWLAIELGPTALPNLL